MSVIYIVDHLAYFLDALKSLLVIERTPSPEPEDVAGSPPPVDLNNLDSEQKKQVARFLQGLVWLLETHNKQQN